MSLEASEGRLAAGVLLAGECRTVCDDIVQAWAVQVNGQVDEPVQTCTCTLDLGCAQTACTTATLYTERPLINDAVSFESDSMQQQAGKANGRTRHDRHSRLALGVLGLLPDWLRLCRAWAW